jgi:hypothetical protein
MTAATIASTPAIRVCQSFALSIRALSQQGTATSDFVQPTASGAPETFAAETCRALRR